MHPTIERVVAERIDQLVEQIEVERNHANHLLSVNAELRPKAGRVDGLEASVSRMEGLLDKIRAAAGVDAHAHELVKAIDGMRRERDALQMRCATMAREHAESLAALVEDAEFIATVSRRAIGADADMDPDIGGVLHAIAAELRARAEVSA